MAFDFSKLRGKIVEKYGTIQSFSDALGQSSVNVSMKLNNKRPWSPEDINKSSELLDIRPKEIGVFFYTPKV